jgi:hypothetical protein
MPGLGCGGDIATTAVGADVPGAEPSGVVAVTVTRTVLPTSAAASLYVLTVAPGIAVHPLVPHRFHWNVYVLALIEIQLPVSADSSVPSATGVPAGGVITGGIVFATARPQFGCAAPADWRMSRELPVLGEIAKRPLLVA